MVPLTAPLRMRAVSAPRGSQTRSMSSVLSESGVWAKLSIACMDTGWWPIGNFDPYIPAGAWCDGAGLRLSSRLITERYRLSAIPDPRGGLGRRLTEGLPLFWWPLGRLLCFPWGMG